MCQTDYKHMQEGVLLGCSVPLKSELVLVVSRIFLSICLLLQTFVLRILYTGLFASEYNILAYKACIGRASY